MTHPYRPADDYPAVTLRGNDKAVVAHATEEARIKLLPALQLGPLSVFCVEPGGLNNIGIDAAATYIAGTASAPRIAIDLDGIKRQAEEYLVRWEDQVRATIARELAHAYGETLGIGQASEEAVEEFARGFVMDNAIDVDTLTDAIERPVSRRRAGRR